MSSREDHVAAASDSRRLRGVVPTGLSEFAKGISKVRMICLVERLRVCTK